MSDVGSVQPSHGSAQHVPASVSSLINDDASAAAVTAAAAAAVAAAQHHGFSHPLQSHQHQHQHLHQHHRHHQEHDEIDEDDEDDEDEDDNDDGGDRIIRSYHHPLPPPCPPSSSSGGEGGERGGGQGGIAKKLHGFSVSEPSIEDAASDAAALAALAITPKKGFGGGMGSIVKLVSLPNTSEAAQPRGGGGGSDSSKLRAGGMRVVLPEQSGGGAPSTESPDSHRPLPQQQQQQQQQPATTAAVVVQGSPTGSSSYPDVVVDGSTSQSLYNAPAASAGAFMAGDVVPAAAAAAVPVPASAPPPPPPPPSTVAMITATASGKVVEPGQEHTGRWTKEEHEAFLTALHMYGKEWKKVAARVKTRTVVQTRTHAQKYFQKLQKVMKTSSSDVAGVGGVGNLGDSAVVVGTVEMGTVSSAKKASSSSLSSSSPPSHGAPKKKDLVRRKAGGMAIPSSVLSSSSSPSSPQLPPPPPHQVHHHLHQQQQQQRRPSLGSNAVAHAAAQLMAQMATSQPLRVPPSSSSSSPAPPPHPSSAAAAPAPAAPSSASPYNAGSDLGRGDYAPSQAYSSVSDGGDGVDVDGGVGEMKLHAAAEADAYGVDRFPGVGGGGGGGGDGDGDGNLVVSGSGGGGDFGSSGGGVAYGTFSTVPVMPAAPPIRAGGAAAASSSISIVAPPPDQTMKRGFFPEPSPAACGKRKLAEIAAAQMLAGVAAIGGGGVASVSHHHHHQQHQQYYQHQHHHQFPPPPPPPAAAAAASSVKGYIDSLSGQATPPPFDDGAYAAGGVSSPVPHGPLESNGGGGRVLSLQIVNPDTLEDGDYGGKRRRVVNGQASPSTPWDGELAALVSEVKNKGTEQNIQAFIGIEDIMGPPLLSDNFSDEAEESPLHPLLESTSRSELHKAVCTESTETVATFLSISNVESFINQCDGDGFFPLHSAAAIGIMEGNPTSESLQNAEEIVRLLLSSGADACCCDSKGNTPLHWAARAGSDRVCHTLIMRNCPLDAPNESGETALHWAMRAGAKGIDAVRVLLQDGARASAFNNDFKRPLDVAAGGFALLEDEKVGQKQGASSAASGGAANAAKGVAAAVGTTADTSATAAAAAAAGKGVDASTAVVDSLLAAERQEARANFFAHSPQSRTLVLHHPDCLDHIPKSSRDWECPDRVQCIMDRIRQETSQDNTMDNRAGIRPDEVFISSEFDRAPLELLSRIHSATYLAFVNDLSKELERRRKQQLVVNNESKEKFDPSVVPFTPMVQRTIMRVSSIKKGTHSDTSFSAGSLRAARRAAGAVQHAVDRVLVGRNRNAFCVVRPPGHHAGVNGLLDGGESCGFCIFNSVAAGAMHALSDESHRPRCERCAIVDIDVHHGNGTEEIIRKCHDPGRLLFFSVHLFDVEKKSKKSSDNYKFYPGTGDKDDVAHNIINVPLPPLWRERGFGNNTGTGGTTLPHIENHHNTRLKKKRQAAAAAAASSKSSVPQDVPSEPNSEAATAGVKTSTNTSDAESSSIDDSASRSSRAVGGGQGGKSSSSLQPSHHQMGVGRLAYRRAIEQRLLPALRAFNPDLILLSTGFDASRGDVGNARHYAGGKERMGLDLEPEDYAWTTRKVIEIADICCQGRVVSVLEGGYGRTPGFENSSDNPNSKEKDHLDRAAFAECAIQHLKALIDPAQVASQNSFDS